MSQQSACDGYNNIYRLHNMIICSYLLADHIIFKLDFAPTVRIVKFINDFSHDLKIL